jgi:hypothetical protein
MLALHSQGKGERDAAAFAGMMSLALHPLSNCWEKMEEELCVSIIAMTTQIIEENLEEEIEFDMLGCGKCHLPPGKGWNFCPRGCKMGPALIRSQI